MSTDVIRETLGIVYSRGGTITCAMKALTALETENAAMREALQDSRDEVQAMERGACVGARHYKERGEDYGDQCDKAFAELRTKANMVVSDIESALTSTPTGDDSVLEIPLGHGTVAVGVGTNSENGLPVISFWRQAKHPVGETIPGTAGTVVPIKDELVRFRIDDPRGAEAVLLEWIKLVPEKVLVDLDEIMESMYILKTAIADLTQGESLSVAEIEQCREAIVLLDNKLKAHDVPA